MKNHGNSRGAKSGSLCTLPVNDKNKHTSSDNEIRPKAFPIVFLQHDEEDAMQTIHITSRHSDIAVTIYFRWFLRTSYIVLLLKAFAFTLVPFHFFAASAVFDEIEAEFFCLA